MLNHAIFLISHFNYGKIYPHVIKLVFTYNAYFSVGNGRIKRTLILDGRAARASPLVTSGTHTDDSLLSDGMHTVQSSQKVKGQSFV
jgi:hypothetical protein